MVFRLQGSNGMVEGASQEETAHTMDAMKSRAKGRTTEGDVPEEDTLLVIYLQPGFTS